MNRDNIRGLGKQIKGHAKGMAGRMAGDDSLRAEGAADRVAGRVQEGWGNLKKEVRDTAAEIRQNVNEASHRDLD
ncbi:MAG TPA: CsbD family protein [Phycisphaerales bacterium]|nr:CsbD family protein [Phycisphaerales bacterium]